MPDDPYEADGGLIDLSGLSLRDLDKLALGSNRDETEAIAGFNNSV
jgi:hypothetical protein